MRLIATDLDGTLLRTDGTVSARTRRVLARAVESGVDVVVVTARPPRYLDAVAESLGLTGVAVCANGAMVYDLSVRSVVTVRPLPLDVARAVASTLAPLDVGFAVETGTHVVVEPAFRPSSHPDVRLATASLADMWTHGVPIVKLLATSASMSADALLAAARSAVGDAAECTHSGGAGLLEVSAAGVSKVSALSALCADRGIAPSEVVAFGDMPNDLAMLAWAGRGYAVANAHPSLLAAVPHHTATNDKDGVAAVVEALLPRILDDLRGPGTPVHPRSTVAPSRVRPG